MACTMLGFFAYLKYKAWIIVVKYEISGSAGLRGDQVSAGANESIY